MAANSADARMRISKSGTATQAQRVVARREWHSEATAAQAAARVAAELDAKCAAGLIDKRSVVYRRWKARVPQPGAAAPPIDVALIEAEGAD